MRIYCFGINLIFTSVIIFAGMVDRLLQSLDSGGYRIPCSCRRPSIHALLQTLVMSQRRSKVVLARILQICGVSEDSFVRFHITVASTMPTS